MVIDGGDALDRLASEAPRRDERDLAMAIVKRCADYVRGFPVPAPADGMRATYASDVLRDCANLLEAQPNAIIASADVQPRASAALGTCSTCRFCQSGRNDCGALIAECTHQHAAATELLGTHVDTWGCPLYASKE